MKDIVRKIMPMLSNGTDMLFVISSPWGAAQGPSTSIVAWDQEWHLNFKFKRNHLKCFAYARQRETNGFRANACETKLNHACRPSWPRRLGARRARWAVRGCAVALCVDPPSYAEKHHFSTFIFLTVTRALRYITAHMTYANFFKHFRTDIQNRIHANSLTVIFFWIDPLSPQCRHHSYITRETLPKAELPSKHESRCVTWLYKWVCRVRHRS